MRIPQLLCALLVLMVAHNAMARTIEVAENEPVRMRVGETLHLKNTDFSLTLEGFAPMACAVPGGNCGVAYRPGPQPQWKVSCNGVAMSADCPYIFTEEDRSSDLRTSYVTRILPRPASRN